MFSQELVCVSVCVCVCVLCVGRHMRQYHTCSGSLMVFDLVFGSVSAPCVSCHSRYRGP